MPAPQPEMLQGAARQRCMQSSSRGPCPIPAGVIVPALPEKNVVEKYKVN